MSSRTRVSIGAIVVVLLVAAIGWWRRDEPRDARGKTVASKPRTNDRGGVSRWIPWFGGGSSGKPGELPDPYQGPRIPVRVKVVDVNGNPVGGVTVEARVDPDEWEFAGLTDEEYDAYIEKKYGEEEEDDAAEQPEEPFVEDDLVSRGGDEWEADSWRISRKPVDSGRTNRDGIYVSKLKPDVDVVFHARDGGGREGVSTLLYLFDDEQMENEESGDEPPKKHEFEVTIELAELGVLAGVVVDERGRPIPGAEVNIMPWGGDLEHEEIIAGDDNSEQRTREDGTFRIALRASGAFDVEVHAKKFQPMTEQAVQVLPGRETSVSITLLASAEVTGIVLDPRGTPVADARVLLQGQPEPHRYVSSDTMTDEEGRFVIEEIAPGRYTLAAMAEGFRPTEIWDVQAGRGDVTLRLTAGGKIHGDVVAARELAVRPSVRSEDGLDVTVDDAGVQLYYGDVYVSVSGEHPEPGEPMPIGIPIATGVPAGREIESPSGTIDVRGRYFTQLTMDETGRGTFDVEGLPPGTYDVTVMIGPAVSRRSQIRVWDGGTANVSMELPDRGAASIAGTIRSSDGRPLHEATVFLYGSLPSGLSTWADENGNFEFRSVPAGDYMLHAAATVRAKTGDDMMITAYVPTTNVHVPGGGRVPLELTAVPSDIPVEDTAFVDGIVSIDGIEVPEPIDGSEFEEEEEEESLWMPELWVEQIDTGLVVTFAPPAPDGKRLFGGDRVTSIDGASVSALESWEAIELLYGPKNSMCRITVERPASHETLSVSLPRDKDIYEMEGHIY